MDKMRDKQLKEKYPELWKDIENSVYDDLLWFLKYAKISYGNRCSMTNKIPDNKDFRAIAHNAAFTACAHVYFDKKK
jgi:hypothetical protein